MQLGPGSGGLSSTSKNGLGYNAVMGYPMGLASRHISGLTERRERAQLESWVVMHFKSVTLEQKGGTEVGKKLPLRNAVVAIHPDRDASGRRTAQLMSAEPGPSCMPLLGCENFTAMPTPTIFPPSPARPGCAFSAQVQRGGPAPIARWC